MSIKARFSSCLFLSFLLFQFSLFLQAQDFSTPLSVTIKIKKEHFKLYEPLEGVITVVNSYPATLGVTFDVKIFHEDELKYHFLHHIESVTLGTNQYSFKEFNIPELTSDSQNRGRWRVIIVQQGVEERYAKEIQFSILVD